MSKGRLGDFADDPNSVFVDVPANPRWILPLDLLLSSAAIVGGFLLAKHLGAGGWLATIVATIVGCVAGFKLSLFAKFRRIPRLTIQEFAEVRSAGSRALAVFRTVHPDLAQVGWSLVAQIPDGRVISVHGSNGGPSRMIQAVHVYAVPPDGAELHDVSVAAYPRTFYCQRLARSECITG